MRKKRDAKLRGELAAFVRQYARKAQRGTEPNDRRYDAKLEKLMKSMSPEELSELLSEETEKE